MTSGGGGGGAAGGVIGDAPVIVEVNQNIGLLPETEQARVIAITADYNADENSLTLLQVEFILDCAKQIVRKLFAS